MLGVAVFTENATLFDHAVLFWQQRLPAYFYLHTDGPEPVPSPRGGTTWHGQTVFNASLDGLCQETCRDLGHTQMGLAAALNGAETAWLQGVDLYAQERTRITTAMEFHARLVRVLLMKKKKKNEGGQEQRWTYEPNTVLCVRSVSCLH